MIELDTPDDRMATAGEYVLGTLATEDMVIFEAAMRQDPTLQRDVYAWQDRLLALSVHAAPDEPTPMLWRRIDVAVAAAVDAIVRPTLSPDVGAPWWRRVLPWQAIGGLALATSAVLAVLLTQRTFSPPPDHFLAVLQSPTDRSNGWIVDVRAGGMLTLSPVSAQAAVPTGSSLQFWTKPQGATAPTSLGLVRAGEAIRLPVSRLPGVGEQQLFEITLEPVGGSPIGKPTGPILFVGRTVHL